MKKYILKIITMTILLTTFISTVNAEEYTEDMFNVGDIVIGSYVYTSKPNEKTGYTGKIDTKFSMLAAKSIASEDVNDMGLYIKLGPNMWFDYLSDDLELVNDLSFPIYITHVDGECVDASCGDKLTVKFVKSDYNDEKTLSVTGNTKIDRNSAPKVREKLGFTFKYWSLKDSEEEFKFDEEIITENIELEARWEQLNYTITYHSNYDLDYPIEKKCTYDENNKEASCKLEKYEDVLADHSNVGHDFLGWSSSSTGKTAYSGIEEVLKNGTTIDLYAIWDSSSYYFKYHEQTVTCYYNENCTLATLTAPEIPGKRLKSWKTVDENPDDDQDTSVNIPSVFINFTSEEKTFNVEPVYESIDYQIIYNLNGGVNAESNPTTINIDGTKILSDVNPTKTGYTFNGWTIAEETPNASLNNNVVSIDSKNPSNVILNANWEVNKLTMTFEDSDGNKYLDKEGNPIEPIICKYDEIDSCKIKATPKTDEEYVTFAGWEYNGLLYNLNAKIDNSNLFSEINRTINMSPKWDNIKKYQITYELNNGIFRSTPVGFYTEETSINLPTPERVGYTFKGWKTNEEDEAEVPFKDTMETTQDDIKLFAVWEPIKYTINYYQEFSESAEAIHTQECTYDEACNIGIPTEKEPEKLIGWSKDGTNLFYGKQLEAINLTTEANKVIKLYAVQEPKYIVSFDLDGGTMEYPESYPYISSINLDTTKPTKEGYTFKGWTINGETEITTGEYTLTKDTMFIARWERIINKVEFIIGDQKYEIPVEYGERINMTTVEATIPLEGNWKYDDPDKPNEEDTLIPNLRTYLENHTFKENAKIRRLFQVTFKVTGTDTIIDSIEYDTNITADQLTGIEMTGTWLIEGVTDPINDLETYLNENKITRDLLIEKVYTITFISNDSTTKTIDKLKYESTLTITDLENNDISTTAIWTIDGTEIVLEDWLRDLIVTEDITLNEKSETPVPDPTPDPTPEPTPEPTPDPVTPTE